MKIKLKERVKNWRWWVSLIPLAVIILAPLVLLPVAVVIDVLTDLYKRTMDAIDKLFKMLVFWVKAGEND